MGTIADFLNAEQLSRAEKVGDFLSTQQLSQSENIGDFLTSQQLSRSERVGEFLTEQYFNNAPKLGNYMTVEEMQNAIYKTGMNGLGCHGCRMGNVTCGGECGERMYDDPDRMRVKVDPSVGGPETPLYNVTPGTDAGPENNDWAVDGMGDIKDAVIANWPLLLGVAGLAYVFRKDIKRMF